MNIKHVESVASSGELWVDDDGMIAIGKEDNYKKFADLDCNDLDYDEREANKAVVVHKCNKFNKALHALKDNLRSYEVVGCFDTMKCRELIEELEHVHLHLPRPEPETPNGEKI